MTNIHTMLLHFSYLTDEDRQAIIEAYWLAPDEGDETEEYFDSAAYRRWVDARAVVLSPVRETSWALDLHEASGYSSSITKQEILDSLDRARGMLR